MHLQIFWTISSKVTELYKNISIIQIKNYIRVGTWIFRRHWANERENWNWRCSAYHTQEHLQSCQLLSIQATLRRDLILNHLPLLIARRLFYQENKEVINIFISLLTWLSAGAIIRKLTMSVAFSPFYPSTLEVVLECQILLHRHVQ